MIELRNVSKHYSPETAALQDITLTIPTGKIFGIVGESGAGKSTLLRILNLLQPPTSGEVLLDNTSIWQLPEKKRRQARQKIGTIFQTPHLLANRNAADNIALPLKLQGKSAPQKVQELLHFVDLADKAAAYPNELSGGQKQRVAIARALVSDPALLLCDEPTSSLDEKNTLELLTLLKEIHQQFQPTIIFVSHELSSVKFLCQEAAILADGKLSAVTSVRPTALEQGESYPSVALRRLQE